MKLPLMPKKKLRATATRRAPGRAIEEEDQEPTVRLSSAFLIVVLLHFVAIGGIYTFESIKTHRRDDAEALPGTKADAAALATQPTTKTAKTITTNTGAAAAAATAATTSKQPSADLLAATVRASDSEAAKKPVKATATAAARESSTIHVVAKGENPHAIARKYGVSYDELIKLNKVTDPTKLQIGQKLQIPAKPRG